MAIKDGDKLPQVSNTPNPHTIAVPPDGEVIGASASDKIAFHGVSPAARRSGASQAAVPVTASTNTSPYGYSQAQADAIVALVNEIRAALVEKGLIKGA